MNKPQHTPGPWRIDHEGKILGPQSGCSSPIIASMPVWWPNKQAGQHASQDHQAANARLIAAAPELLEALQALYRETADYIRINNLGEVHHNRSMRMASLAIAKATEN